MIMMVNDLLPVVRQYLLPALRVLNGFNGLFWRTDSKEPPLVFLAAVVDKGGFHGLAQQTAWLAFACFREAHGPRLPCPISFEVVSADDGSALEDLVARWAIVE